MMNFAKVITVVALPVLVAACATAPFQSAKVDLRDACVFSADPAQRPQPKAKKNASPIVQTLYERGRRIPVRRFTGLLDQKRFERQVQRDSLGCQAPNLG